MWGMAHTSLTIPSVGQADPRSACALLVVPVGSLLSRRASHHAKHKGRQLMILSERCRPLGSAAPDRWSPQHSRSVCCRVRETPRSAKRTLHTDTRGEWNSLHASRMPHQTVAAESMPPHATSCQKTPQGRRGGHSAPYEPSVSLRRRATRQAWQRFGSTSPRSA